MTHPVNPHCRAFQDAIAILGRPWTALILGLLQKGPLRFGELEESASGVGAKTLSARLKELESKGLLVRRVDPGPPVRVDYALTHRGEAFNQVAAAIERWGHELVDVSPARARKPVKSKARASG